MAAQRRRKRPAPMTRREAEAEEEARRAYLESRPPEVWTTARYACPVHGEHRCTALGPARTTCQRTYSCGLTGGVSMPLCDLPATVVVERQWRR